MPALADDLVWQLYRDDGPGGTLAVMDKGELESPEPYWHLAFQCIPGEDWTMIVGDIDTSALAAVINDDGPAEVSFVVDGELGGHGLGGYFPDIRFGEMFGEWEYWIPLDLDMLRQLAAAKTLAIKGTGVDHALPSEGLAETFGKFVDACTKLEQTRGQPGG